MIPLDCCPYLLANSVAVRKSAGGVCVARMLTDRDAGSGVKSPFRRARCGGVKRGKGNGKGCGTVMIWLAAKLNHVGECPLRDSGGNDFFSPSPARPPQIPLAAFAMLPAVRVGGDVLLMDVGGGQAAGRGRVTRLPRMTPQSSSNLSKGHEPAFRRQADFPAGVTAGRQG